MATIDEKLDELMHLGKQTVELLTKLVTGNPADANPGPVQPGPRKRATKESPNWDLPMTGFDADEVLDRAVFGWAPDGRQLNSGPQLAAVQAEWKRLSAMSEEQWTADARGSAYVAAKLSTDAVCFLIHLGLIDASDPWRFFGGRGQFDAAAWQGCGLEQAVARYIETTVGTGGPGIGGTD